jgi:hypothetical protein
MSKSPHDLGLPSLPSWAHVCLHYVLKPAGPILSWHLFPLPETLCLAQLVVLRHQHTALPLSKGWSPSALPPQPVHLHTTAHHSTPHPLLTPCFLVCFLSPQPRRLILHRERLHLLCSQLPQDRHSIHAFWVGLVWLFVWLVGWMAVWFWFWFWFSPGAGRALA